MQKSNDLPPVPVEAQPIGFFETPVAYCRLKDGEALLQQLEAAIRQHKKDNPGIQRSNYGGWHSRSDMLTWGGEAAQRLAETAIKLCKRMSHFQEATVDGFDWTVRMWANVTAPGGLNYMHVHPGNLWAVVLYVDMGDSAEDPEDCGGEFFIEDPRFPMSTMRETSLRLRGVDGQPQELQVDFNLKRGNLVVFPAWLRHGVRPYQGKRERISIAMNVDATPKL